MLNSRGAAVSPSPSSNCRAQLEIKDYFFYRLFSMSLHNLPTSLTFSSSCSCQLTSLPTDVLEYHIINSLNLPSIIACYMVNLRFRGIALRCRAKLDSPDTISKQKNQCMILQDLFKYGNLELLVWFRKALQYPSTLSSLLFIGKPCYADLIPECLKLAVAGI